MLADAAEARTPARWGRHFGIRGPETAAATMLIHPRTQIPPGRVLASGARKGRAHTHEGVERRTLVRRGHTHTLTHTHTHALTHAFTHSRSARARVRGKAYTNYEGSGSSGSAREGRECERDHREIGKRGDTTARACTTERGGRGTSDARSRDEHEPGRRRMNMRTCAHTGERVGRRDRGSRLYYRVR